MANVKISELPLGTPNSSSTFPFVDSGVTYRGLISAITANSVSDTFVTGFSSNNNVITLSQNRDDQYSEFTINLSAYTGQTLFENISIHQPDDSSSAILLYNDTYDSISPSFGMFVWNTGDVAFGMEEDKQLEIYTNANYNNPVITISGSNVNVNGNFVVNNVGIYKALLTQTGSLTGTSMSDFDYGFIPGETYQITNYVAGDDFSNVGNVISGVMNETGCEFIATGQTPINYTNGSEIVSNGGLIVDTLENTLGFTVSWSWDPLGGSGYYVAVNETYNSPENSFPKNKIFANTQLNNTSFYSGSPYNSISITPYSFMGKDNMVVLTVYNLDLDDSVENALYYTPVEINLSKDITPVVVNSSIIDSYPFNNVSVRILCEGNLVTTFYTNNSDPVNNVVELIDRLNSESGTNILGTFSNDGEIVELTMITDVKNYFCEDRTITIEIFQD